MRVRKRRSVLLPQALVLLALSAGASAAAASERDAGAPGDALAEAPTLEAPVTDALAVTQCDTGEASPSSNDASEPAPPADAPAPVSPETLAQLHALAGHIRAEHWDEAYAALDAMSAEDRAHPQTMFLEAMLMRRTGEPRLAIDIYQRMLSENSSLLRVRLELAQTYAEIGADRAAEQNYRLALAAQNVPPGVQARIQRELIALGERRRWLFQVNMAIAPDSNVNGATDAERTQIFGLPFELSDDARRRGGINFTAFASADRFIRLAPTHRLRLSAFTRLTDNEGGEFDDYTLGLRGGPEWRRGQAIFSLAAVGERRWYANDPYSKTVGLRAEATLVSNRLTQYALSSSVVSYDEDRTEARDGWIYGLDTVRTRYLTPNKFWRFSASARRNEAEAGFESYWSGRVAIGGYSTLPYGFSIYIEPAYTQRDYDETHPFFRVVREDQEFSLTGRLVKRDWTINGLTPYIGVTHLDNQSNVATQNFQRRRFEFGFTRSF